MSQAKSAFDYSGASIWTKDKKLAQINNGKINGQKRRAQYKHTEEFGLHPIQEKAKDGKS
jgi:hypothetical protein